MTTGTITSRGGVTAAAALSLRQSQIDAGSNLAGNDEVDARVRKYVKAKVREFQDRISPLHYRWRITNFMLSGNTIDRTGPVSVHVPELYKMVETLVPRLEEMVLDKDPSFRVKGRQEMDEKKALSIAAFLDWQLDQAGFRSLVQPAIRDMLVTQVGVFKVLWDTRIEKRRQKVVDTKVVGTVVKKTVRREERDTLIYDGPRIKLVDPFDFIIDPKATGPQDALYVGDRSYWTFDELKEFERQGYLKNVDELKREESGGSIYGNDADHYKWSRSPTERYGVNYYGSDYQKIAGQPKLYEIVSLWGQFNLSGTDADPIYEEAVLTVGNGRVVLQAMPNPHDFKQRPYATIRAARNGHDFFGIGPLDNAVRLNQYLDHYHSIFLRAAQVAACPIVFAEEDSDLPDSLYNVQPFKVYKGVGNVRMTQVPDGMLKNAPLVIGMLTRNIEETVGAFKIQMGQESTAETATQASISNQEGNRRNRGLVRNIADGLGQTLRIMHQYNVQMVTDEVAFRVIGKRAADLKGEYIKVGPDTFLEEVDFEFVGLDSLHTYGMRASGLQQIMATAGPLIIQNPDRVNSIGILHELFSALVGPEEADRYVNVPEDRSARMSQEEENVLLLEGIEIEASQDDPHEDHLAKIVPFLQRLLHDKQAGKPISERSLELVAAHAMQHHFFQARQKEAQSVRDREAQARQSILAPEAGGTPAQGGPQQPTKQATSPMQGGTSAAMRTPPGQNPGPADGRKQGTMGRAGKPVDQENDRI